MPERVVFRRTRSSTHPAYTLVYASGVDPTTGALIWTDLPDVLKLDEEMTAKPGEPYRGKLVVGIAMDRAFIAEWYDDTTLHQSLNSDAAHKAVFEIPLPPGVHDLGFEIDNLVDGARYFTDFRRVKVLYERPDLSGTWQGTYRIQESVNARQYVEDGLVQVLLWTGLAQDEAEAREIAAEAIVEDPNLYRDRSLVIELEAVDPDKGDHYRTHISLEGDPGETSEYSGKATFKGGVLTFDLKSADGTTMTFTGTPSGTAHLSGTFSATAWVVVKDALSGSWELKGREP